MDDIDDICTIRSYTGDDLSFIMNSWLNGLKQGCEYFRLIDKDPYFDIYGKILSQIIEKPATYIKIACLKEDPSIIVGYSVTELRPGMLILHWVYVKPDWRDNGLARKLIPENITHATHLTKTGRALLKKNEQVKFNPFII
jgi:GNAT superfamily N-acetyltransferase